MIDKTAVILAGGKGTRLYPYTVALPKPLVPVGDKPILEIMVIRLSQCGFKHIIITVNHQADIVMAYMGDGAKCGVNIEYSLETKPLGTMGPLRLIKNLPDDFLVMNGDVLTDMDFAGFLDEHKAGGCIFSISSHKRDQKNDYGVLEVSCDGKLSGFKEKPVTHYNVSMGVYAASKRILNYIPENEYFGFDGLMKELLDKKLDVCVIEHKGYWMDVGRPDDYAKATADVENGVFEY